MDLNGGQITDNLNISGHWLVKILMAALSEKQSSAKARRLSSNFSYATLSIRNQISTRQLKLR